MKNLFYSVVLLFCSNLLFAQEWNSNYPNILHAENGSNNLTPVLVGVGTATPQRQLHTTGEVRFAGVPSSATIPNYILGADNDGDLTRFNSNLLGDNNSWSLSGNNAVSTANFIGTINNQSFRVRTNNIQRMVVTNTGRVGINTNAPLFQFETRYKNNTSYIPNILGNGNWNNSDGIFLYNNQTGSTSNRFTSITLGTISGNQLSISKINSIGTATGESALTFQTENSRGGSDDIKERMRITASGTVAINLQNNSDNSLALHTSGNLQFDNLPNGNGRILVLDANNRVRISQQPLSFKADSNDGQKKYVQELEDRITKLEQQLKVIISLNDRSLGANNMLQIKKGSLSQNVPNPTTQSAKVDYSIESDFSKARLLLFNNSGQIVKTFSIANNAGSIQIDTRKLVSGTYIYSLEVDGQILKSRKLIKK